MADKRINALTTTSASVGDDYFAIDGATNGTRALSAFSPSFGGNATVTGTLTVNGASAAISGGTPSGNQRLALSNAYDATQIGAFYGAPATSLKFFNVGWDVATYGSNFGGYTIGGNRGIAGATSDSHLRLFCPASHEIRFSTISSNDGWTTTNPSFTTLATISSTALTVNATTASTTTSTGALVVGNGTSGGLGVGGAANIGGTLTVSNPVVAQGTTVTGYQFLAKDTGGTAVGAAYALQTSGGTDKWRWGLRGSAGSLTDSLIFSALDGSWVDALTLGKTGNATFAGTLTVSGTGTTTIGGTGAVGSPRLFLSGDAGLQIKNATSSRYRVDFYANNVIAKGVLDAYDDTGSAYIPLLISGSRLEVDNTTASTTTSSGALVVSGGVGVAGAIYAGNAINATVNGGASIIGRNGSASSFTSIVAYSGASDEVKGTLTSSTAGVIIVGSQTNHPLAVYVNNSEVARWDTSANFQTRVTGTAPSLATNSTMTFELTSNTSLKIFVRGSDGTTRSTTLTLA